MVEPPHLATTRASYDTAAVAYAELVRDALASRPLVRGLLATFADLVRAADVGPVVDVGCGPGHLTAHLTALGVAASGVDLSPGMIDVARHDHPGIRFDLGSMTDLDLPDASVGGVLAWYSTVHVPPDVLPAVLAEFHRVLAPGGHLLIAFKVGDGSTHLDRAYGHAVSLDVHRLPTRTVVGLLDAAGLVTDVRVRQEASGDGADPQGYLLARRPR